MSFKLYFIGFFLISVKSFVFLTKITGDFFSNDVDFFQLKKIKVTNALAIRSTL